MKILHLTLKKKWFDMILSGEKTEEYRELKPHWMDRLTHFDNKWHRKYREYAIENLKGNNMQVWKYEYDCIRFTNGYSPNSPSFDIEYTTLSVGNGRSEWGAVDGVEYFVISLGKIISTKNIKS